MAKKTTEPKRWESYQEYMKSPEGRRIAVESSIDRALRDLYVLTGNDGATIRVTFPRLNIGDAIGMIRLLSGFPAYSIEEDPE